MCCTQKCSELSVLKVKFAVKKSTFQRKPQGSHTPGLCQT